MLSAKSASHRTCWRQWQRSTHLVDSSLSFSVTEALCFRSICKLGWINIQEPRRPLKYRSSAQNFVISLQWTGYSNGHLAIGHLASGNVTNDWIPSCTILGSHHHTGDTAKIEQTRSMKEMMHYCTLFCTIISYRILPGIRLIQNDVNREETPWTECVAHAFHCITVGIPMNIN